MYNGKNELFSFFFFSSRRRHTRFDCDWSSDVCSSDLTGPYIRNNRTRTHPTMRSRNPTAHQVLTVAAFAWLCSSILYLGSGCAGGTAARNDSALNAYVQGVRAYQSGDTDKAMANLKDA